MRTIAVSTLFLPLVQPSRAKGRRHGKGRDDRGVHPGGPAAIPPQDPALPGRAGADMVMLGILPTIREEHFDARWLSPSSRYAVLNEQIFAARGEAMLLNMEGPPMPGRPPERLRTYTESILPEAACTSAQLHLQVKPEDFAAHWNAAQCLAGP